ncbi:hypothetical protein KPH14_008058 [Odynerus spinipes]|uniref:Uncharacterized protein n=1 Tax=Odynerus spinipes TaxID=1348599 RepID=A0AAD9VNL5_9HYME|nr:hypothetical protein KPH14_008058 [Odynerus spinipes]
MELSKSSSDIDDNNVTNLSEDASSIKIIKLEKEIEDLENTVKQLKAKLNAVKFDDEGLTESNDAGPTDIKLELYKYSGLYCTVANKSEQVIAFNSASREQQENQCAIQFLKEGRKMKTGKWVMPMSVDINQLKNEIPLNNIRNLLHFVKNSKHYVDCYQSRSQQFQELKSSVGNLRFCDVHSNLGYTSVILELLNVHDKEENSYVNTTIYLWYNSKRARPTEIKIDIIGSTEYDREIQKELKKSVKVFQSMNLQTAFDNILTDNNKRFTWERIQKDTALEIDECSSTEEDEDWEEYSFHKKAQSRKISRKRRRQRLKKQNRKKKKEDNSDELKQQNANVKEANKPTSSQVSSKIQSRRSDSAYQSTLDKFAYNLSFKKKRKSDLEIAQKKYNIKPLSVTLNRINKKFTSTPIRSYPTGHTPFKVLPSFDISNINENDSS